MPRRVQPLRKRSPGGPITGWLFSVALVLIVVLGAAVISILLLLKAVMPLTPIDRLEVIRTGLAVAAGAGALITLLYAIRRQLLSEQVALDTKTDATEKRITELYVKGIEQFSASAIQARFGGLYALERLGDDEPRLRGTIVDVLCAYLRGASTQSEEDKDLRTSIQIVMIDHLALDSKFSIHKDHWQVREVRLGKSLLHLGYFRAFTVHTAHFDDCTFLRKAEFQDARIRGADFGRATFQGGASFKGAHIDWGIFTKADFQKDAIFDNVHFGAQVDFTDTQFHGSASFANATVELKETGNIVLPAGWLTRPATPEEASQIQHSGTLAFIERAAQ